MAKEKGFYSDAGLEVDIYDGYKKDVYRDVEKGYVDFGISGSRIIYERLQGRKFVALATIFQTSPLVFLSKKESNITRPGDLIGKTVMNTGKNDIELLAILKKEGIDISKINFVPTSYYIDDLISGKCDVFSAYRSNEPYKLQQKGIEVNTIYPATYGIDFYGDILFTSRSYLEEHPKQVKAFRSASLKGWEYAFNHTEETVALIHEKYRPDKSIDHLIYEAKILQKQSMYPVIEMGHMNAGRWSCIANMFKELGYTQNSEIPEDFLYNPSPDKHRFIKPLLYIIILGILAFLLLLYVYRKHKHILEKRVAERTKDLQHMNLLLEDKINTRTKKLLVQKNILHHKAHHDTLTGLPNRLFLNDRLEQVIKKSGDTNKEFALFFIDIDKFKDINDSLGHQVGDKVLKEFSRRIKFKIRAEDTLARISGDEFTIIMENIRSEEDVSSLANYIIAILSKPMYIGEHILHVTSSIGISLYPKDSTNVQNLLKYADIAMYNAKEKGRNNFQFYSVEMSKSLLERIELEANLRQSIRKEEISVHYQPLFNAESQKLIGIEALARWHDPILGVVPTEKFISLAEESDLILDIDCFVMNHAMKQHVKWYKDGLQPGILALNISMKMLESGKFLQTLQENMNKTGFKPSWLELEITERDMMKKPDATISKLREINDMGVHISIDDFGTGYSSLSYLKRLPVSKLKIDQSFIRDIPKDEEDVAIIKAIISLAQSLNLGIVAEGVETKDQKEFLIESGCVNMQGHLYSKSLTAEAMEEMLQSKIYFMYTIECIL